MDYIRGFCRDVSYDGKSLKLESGAETGCFLSRLLDSREKGMAWHRITMDTATLGEASIQVAFYGTDQKAIACHDRMWDLDELIQTEEVELEDKLKAFAPYLQKRALNPADLLLHEVKGQYLWFAAELFGQGSESPKLGNIRIQFPMESWISYLPAVYRQEKESARFLESYLGVFQSVYQDLEEKIRQSAGCLDADTDQDEFLSWMAGWLDIEDTRFWNREKLRQFLKTATELFGMRGTRQGLVRMLELYLGVKPLVVEYAEAEQYHLSRFYGIDENSFAVLLPEACVPSAKEYETVLHLIQETVPVHMQFQMELMKPMMLLGSYSYVGINSRLGHYQPLKLDGRSLLPFTAITGRQGGEA